MNATDDSSTATGVIEKEQSLPRADRLLLDDQKSASFPPVGGNASRGLEAYFQVISGDGAVAVYTSSTDNGTGDSILRTD